MSYHLHFQGQDQGAFPLEELKRRRLAGELNGSELVWREGMSSWEPLDAVLGIPPAGTSSGAVPPPVIASKRQGRLKLWVCLTGAALLVAVAGLLIALNLTRRAAQVTLETSRPDPVKLAGKPVAVNPKSATAAEVGQRAKAFRVRTWLSGYAERGAADEPCRSDGLKYIEAWLARNYGGETTAHEGSLLEWTDKLAAQCKDPLLLTILAVNSSTHDEWVHRLEAALDGFSTSAHPAYVKFYASVILAKQLSNDRARVAALDASSLERLAQAFQDGSITPGDQAEIAELLVSGWANPFFRRHHSSLFRLPRAASMPWLADVLEGEHHVIEAWKARGGGFSDSVSQKGWQGFETHLAQARTAFTAAWERQPDLPLAAGRMIYVALGDAGLEEMRAWFDKAVGAQIDYAEAWSNLRWGLRPRWYGSEEAMLAFGITAVDTARFDTDVPRKFFDTVADLENEQKLAFGEHIYGRSDIWPHLRRMYEGYIGEPSALARQDGWRSTYAAIAYLAEKYDVAREQLQALRWQPMPVNLSSWGRDLSLMPLEVAARTGAANGRIALAESQRNRGAMTEALSSYSRIDLGTLGDDQSKRFVEHRLASLALEKELEQGRAVDFLPARDGDLNWVVRRGQFRVQPDKAVEVTTSKGGHLFVSRVRVGPDFEAQGEFEIVQTVGPTCQLGLAMGQPEMESSNWYSFTIKRNSKQEDFACFSCAWGNDELYRPIKLEPGPNAFRLQVQGGKVSAWLNGKEVFHQAKPPRTIASRPSEYLLGVGAFNEGSGDVIRYRNFRVQRLNVVRRAANGE